MSSQLRVLQVVDSLWVGGTERWVVALYPVEERGELPLRPDDVRFVADGRWRLEKLPGIQPGLVRSLLAAVDAFEPDVVQVNGSRAV